MTATRMAEVVAMLEGRIEVLVDTRSAMSLGEHSSGRLEMAFDLYKAITGTKHRNDWRPL